MTGYFLFVRGSVAIANSIQGRFPFLNYRVVEYANQFPSQLKLLGLTEKYRLKKSVARLQSNIGRMRVKHSYHAPSCQSPFNANRALGHVAELFSKLKISHTWYFDEVAMDRIFVKYLTSSSR